MEIKIHGDKLKITKAMNDYIEEKLEKLDKYLENSDNVHANVIVKVKNHEQIVEITIPLKTVILRSEETQNDFYAAVDKIMAKQAKTHVDFNFPEMNYEEEEEEENESKIVKRKKIDVKPMNEEEAILQMELLGHQFYMYKDADTDKATVVYKRNDGNYGIIESN